MLAKHALILSLLTLPLSGDVVINEFLTGNDSIVVPNAEAGRFEDWIELSNTTNSAVDLGGWQLTDDPNDITRWTFPAGTMISPNGFLVVFASGDGMPDGNGNLHTNFKLSKNGDYLGLSEPGGDLVSEFGPDGSPYPDQSDDVSYGLHPDTGDSVYFDEPSPQGTNDPTGIARVESLTVSPRRGLYQTAQQVTLTTATEGATIYYTTDGNPPVTSSGNPTGTATAYSAPISINQTTVIRAAATANGVSPSEPVAHTYLLFDIDNAAPNGSDDAGLNTPFLTQSKPAGTGNFPSGDYNMDTRITRSTAASAGHEGLTVAQAMLEGLREVPSISISMPQADFFTIYANPQSTGDNFEKACSAEFIPIEGDSRSDFQENCGLRVQGGASRRPDRSPKHSLSFRFRNEYGAGRLREELFPGVDVENFNSIALRAGYNNSWIHSNGDQRGRGSMIRDQWMRESMRDMGHEDAGAGFLAHVFVNGLYWGLHNVAERQDNAHYAEYGGGDSDLIDARNGSKFVEGNSTAWNAMRSTVSSRNWEDILGVLDVDNYIDFQILQRFGANQDLKNDGNWRAAGGGPFTNPTDMRPWKMYSWDGERVLENPSANNVPLDPMNVRGSLEAIPEYRQRFADRAYRHLNGDGALTPENTRARWEKYADAIDKAIIAESARWGDHRRSTPYDRDDWLTEQNRLYNTYFPVRTQNVINRLRTANLYPDAEAPGFAINGANADGGFVGAGALTLNGEDGTIYYTLDGSDPFLPDGTLRDGVQSLSSGVMSESVFPFESMGWCYLNNGVAQSSSNIVAGNAGFDMSDWKHQNFSDDSWSVGQGLLGGRNANSVRAATANTVIDIGPVGEGLPTVYFRKSFNITDAAEVTAVEFEMYRDDGVIVYLNGHEIYRENMPNGTVAYADFASSAGDEGETLSHTHPLAAGQLLEGNNVLAVELHNSSAGSSDLGLDVSLSILRPAGVTSIALAESAQVTARLQSENGISAPISGTFLLEQAASSANLALSEINYHPREATLLEKNTAAPLMIENRDDFEFIELLNIGSEDLNLAGASFADGIRVDLGLRAVGPGERVLLVKNEEAFLSRYGDTLDSQIVGTFSGSLDNDGESLVLEDHTGATIQSLSYNDSGSWPSRPDGDGSSLEIVDPSAIASDPDNWEPSVSFHGSPGTMGLIRDQRIVINEVRSNSEMDAIELHNTTSSPLDIGGWLLTDSKNVYQSFSIPETTLGGLEYFVLNNADYNAPATGVISNYAGTPGASPTTVASAAHGLATGDLISIENYGGFSDYNESFEVTVINANSFSIDALFLDNDASKGNWQLGRAFGISGTSGDDLWLLETDNEGRPVAFVDHVEFAAAAPNATLGRWLDGMGYDILTTMVSPTLGSENSGPLLGPVFISEVHYAPMTSDDHEFVELTNNGTSAVSLERWRLRGGLDFDFADGQMIAPGQSLVVVSFDPAVATALASDFRTTFGIANEIILLGPASDGPLGNDQGTVRLQRAGAAPEFGQITVDEVRYLSSASWPNATTGSSLTRGTTLTFGNFATSWLAASPTLGSITSGEDYATWATANGVGGANEDPDGDFLNNLLEFAMGTDPNTKDDLPALVKSGTSGTVTFGKHLGRAGVLLNFETSNDLQNWTPQVTTPTGTVNSVQTNEFTIDLPSNSKLFWRFRAIAQ